MSCLRRFADLEDLCLFTLFMLFLLNRIPTPEPCCNDFPVDSKVLPNACFPHLFNDVLKLSPRSVS